MKLRNFLQKTFYAFLLLSLIFGQSLTLAADKDFEAVLRDIPRQTPAVSCFISHAWEGSNPNPLVSRLERHLDSAGIVTYFDNRDDERGAKDGIPSFMNNIAETDYVLMVFTPVFKDKYKAKTNIATEVNYVISSLLNQFPEKIVPVLFSGTQDTAIPPLLKPLRYYDFRHHGTYYDQFFKILGHMMEARVTELNQLRSSFLLGALGHYEPPTAQMTQMVVAPSKEKTGSRPTSSKSILTFAAKEEWKEESKSSFKTLEKTIALPPVIVKGIIERPMSTPIPEIAIGNEEDYLRFLGGFLIYKQGQSDEEIRLPILSLTNPIEGTFDLSLCGDAGKYLSIATGYRKGEKVENQNKTEVWIVPKFVVVKNQTSSAKHLAPIMSSFSSPVGLFWTYGNWDNSEEQMGWFDYLTSQNFDRLSNGENIHEKWSYATGRGRGGAARVGRLQSAFFFSFN
ncbi:MAG: toll/interleukin-1 receptor domain-containing protein [Alphaproteobacteria bacterium]|nr:toll/interleukin-1 receptor domain-containing protein [Alphaproteobacteria bacterium]